MNRGEIWLVDLNRATGDEMSKVRPAVIINDDNIGILDLRIIVPFTTWQDDFDSNSWLIKIKKGSNNLINDSAADVFQVKSISTKYLRRQVGVLSSQELKEIELGLVKVLGII